MGIRRYCEQCGMALSDTAKFCENCGARVPQAAKPLQEGRPQRRSEELSQERRPQRRADEPPQMNRPQPGAGAAEQNNQMTGQTSRSRRPRAPYEDVPEWQIRQNSQGRDLYANGSSNGGIEYREPGRYHNDSGYREPQRMERQRRYRQEELEHDWQQSWEREMDDEEEQGFTAVQYLLIGIAVVLLMVLVGFGVYWMLGRSTGNSSRNRNQNSAATEAVQSDRTAVGTEEQITILDDTRDKETEAQTAAVTQTERQTETAVQTETEPAEDIVLNYSEFSVTLPGTWKGKYGITQSTDSYIFYQQASKARGYGGTLFTISRYTDTTYKQLLNYDVIGTGNGTAFIYQLPTDVQYASDDQSAADEYRAMAQELTWIRSNLKMLVSGEGPKETEPEPIEILDEGQQDYSGGYIPESSQRAITDADVAGMSYDDMQMAINEIYARHGRIFQTEEIANYFNSQSWYQGTVTAENFSESVFSSVESQNIQFLLQKMGTQ